MGIWNLLSYLTEIVCYYLNRMKKLVLKLSTGLSEIERICLNYTDACKRTMKLEQCLRDSANGDFTNALDAENKLSKDDIEAIAIRILEVRKISPINPRVINAMKVSLAKIHSYRVLVARVNQLKSTQVSFDNKIHFMKIMNVWNALKSQDELKMIKSKRWSEIGFQGDDPQTDFRSMGLLALECLEYFSTHPKFSNIALNMCSKSNHPMYGYSWAIAGINITSWIYSWLQMGNLKGVFYSDSRESFDQDYLMSKFCEIFCVVFFEFDRFWFINQLSILYFETAAKPFRKMVERKLREDNLRIEYEFLGELHKDKSITALLTKRS